jgi:tetratricopeptide (TPR) repeat protein
MKTKLIFIISIFIFNVCIIFSQDTTSDKTKSTQPQQQQQTQQLSSTPEQTNTQTTNPIKNEQQKQKNGWELYLDGRYTESVNALVEEKKNFPDRVNIYVILGWDYYYLKRFKEMEIVSAEGIKVAPNDIRIVKNLAEAYYFQGMFMEAVSYFEKYIKSRINENDPYINQAYYYLGICYYNIKLYRKADVALSTAKYFKPNDLKLTLILADINERLNEKEKARKLYETVVSIDPSNTQALDGLKRVKNPQ